MLRWLPIALLAANRCWTPQVARRAVRVNYALEAEASKQAPGAGRQAVALGDDGAFDQERLLDYLQARPVEVLSRLLSTLWIAAGIWWAWRQPGEAPVELSTSTTRRRSSKKGDTLRKGLQQMGVFFVKVGQTAAQRPDIVGDEAPNKGDERSKATLLGRGTGDHRSFEVLGGLWELFFSLQARWRRS